MIMPVIKRTDRSTKEIVLLINLSGIIRTNMSTKMDTLVTKLRLTGIVKVVQRVGDTTKNIHRIIKLENSLSKHRVAIINHS
jgi:hypothetical protein